MKNFEDSGESMTGKGYQVRFFGMMKLYSDCGEGYIN